MLTRIIVSVGLVIGWHELGHPSSAKACSVGVQRCSVGVRTKLFYFRICPARYPLRGVILQELFLEAHHGGLKGKKLAAALRSAMSIWGTRALVGLVIVIVAQLFFG